MQHDDLNTALHRALAHEKRLLVAFSGGLDSTALLHRLTQSGWSSERLRAIHIHHGISPQADSWALHCQTICQHWKIPLQVVRVQLHDHGQGLEAQARQARYNAFADALQAEEALVCAHHLDDQSETLLLALKRGSGPAGLAAMPERLPFAGSVLIRPLLSITRAQLACYAQQHHLQWIDDESNQHQRFDRNFLRLRIMPLLQQRWPHLPHALARSAQLCGEQEQLLDELLADELTQLIRADGSLPIPPLKAMSDIRRAALLRRWLAQQGATPPSRAALNRLWQEVALSRQDANPCLQLGTHQVRRFAQTLCWRPCPPATPATALNWLPPFTPLDLPARLGRLSLQKPGEMQPDESPPVLATHPASHPHATPAHKAIIHKTIVHKAIVHKTTEHKTTEHKATVRPPTPDETVSIQFQAPGLWHIVGRRHRRTLKKLWQEMHIPPWQRGHIPLLFYNAKLIAAPGIFVTLEGQPVSSSESDCWHIHWQTDESTPLR